MNLKNWLWVHLSLLYGRYFSLDKVFRKNDAVAIIHFIEGESDSIKISINGMLYCFEGAPKIEEYKNAAGKIVVRKELKYGGWEMDLQHPNNRIKIF